MPTVLTRDEIRAFDDRRIEFVAIPQWGKDANGEDKGVYVKGLTGRGRDRYELSTLQQRGKKREINLANMRARLVSLCAVDGPDPDTAKRLFDDRDVEWLGEKSADVLQLIYAKARELSGLSQEDEEELTFALGEDTSDDSGSDSPHTSESPTSISSKIGSAASSSLSGVPSTGSNPSETGT